MRRRLSFKTPLEVPWQARCEQLIQVFGREGGNAGALFEEWRERVAWICRECRIGKVRPFLTLSCAKKRDALAQLLLVRGPGQPSDAAPGNAFGKNARALGSHFDRQVLLNENYRA
jgi:hypothetical protein